MSGILPASLDIVTAGALRVAAGLAGILAILYFFKSIIRVGVLNQRYQDPLAFWVGRVLLNLFRFRIARLPKGDPKRPRRAFHQNNDTGNVPSTHVPPD